MRTKKKVGSGRLRESRDGKIRKLRNVRFSDAEWAWLKEAAEESGRSLAAFVRLKVLRGMEKENPNSQP
jgi:hypothetical protein